MPIWIGIYMFFKNFIIGIADGCKGIDRKMCGEGCE